MSNLKPWWQVATPHKDIREGKLDESVFAADLGEVHAGRGVVDYQDPVTFFNRTYLTSGLSSMLSDVLSRLSGKGKGERVIQIQTPFGGGKTHTLLSLYHLFEHPREVKNLEVVKNLLAQNQIKMLPRVKKVVLVGTALNPKTDKTLWGELASQLGKDAYKLIEENDKGRISPGTDVLGKILAENQPCLILMDEVLQYLTKAFGVDVGDGSLGGQTLSFLQELTIAVANQKTSVLIATLPSSVQERYDESTEEAFGKLARVFGRVETIRTPVEGEEIYEILRRRLFEEIGEEKDRQQVAQAYWDLYQKLSSDLPRKVREVEYKKRLEKAYPFHPELVEIFYERWGSLPGFQRTRGVLRLLARIVADLYQNQHRGIIIQPVFINLANQNLRSELIKHSFVGSQYDSVVSSDISGPTAKAPQIDRELGTEYIREQVSEGLATAIFLYSFAGGKDRGASEQQLRLSVLTPTLTPAIIAEGLSRLSRRLWYLYTNEGDMFRFSTQPNLNKMLIDKEDAVSQEEVSGIVRNKLEDTVGLSRFKVYLWPEEDRDIADVPELSLAVLGLNHVKSDEEWEAAEKFIKKIVENHGGTFRKYKNALIFLVGDKNGKKGLIDIIKRLLALRRIEEEYQGEEKLSEEQRKDLTTRLQDTERKLVPAIHNAYRHVLVAGKEKEELRHFDLGLQALDGEKTLSDKVYESLRAHEKLLDKLDPSLLTSKRFGVWPEDQLVINLKTLKDGFAQYTHLPMLETPQTLASTASAGTARGVFGYGLGEGESFEPANVYDQHRPIETENIEFSESAWLIKPERVREILPLEAGEVSVVGKGTEAGAVPFTEEGLAPKDEKPGKAGKQYKSLSIKAKIPWDKWTDVLEYILRPLVREGADVETEVEIKASSESGISENTVELGIKESLSQKNIEADIEGK